MRTLLLPILLSLIANFAYAQTPQKNRTIILTDIENEPDDKQSLVRLLLYYNEIDLEGIIATTSCWMPDAVHPQSITQVIQAMKRYSQT